MTCIVGIADQNGVLIGGDSAGVAGYDIQVRSDSKVFNVGPYVMGFTTSFRMGQLLRYKLAAPEPTTWDIDRFMATDFVDAVRACLKDGGYATTKDGGEIGGCFLVGYRSMLYLVASDYQIGRVVDGYMAVGCGAAIALGSLHSTAGMPSDHRLNAALEAASHHSAGVTGPFTIATTSPS